MAFAVVLQACGDDAAPRGPEPKVRLQVTVPQDGATVRAETVAVEGTVAPAGARVQVLGKDVGVESGRWHAEVPLEPGANLVDVAMEDAGGFLDPLLPGDPKVCSIKPDPGTQVLPGSSVTLAVARDC